jgi:hypothetical protein
MTGDQILILVGIVVSGGLGAYGLWQANRARSHSLRDAVFATQLDLLHATIAELHQAFGAAGLLVPLNIHAKKTVADDEYELRVKDAYRQLRGLLVRITLARAFLPNSVLQALVETWRALFFTAGSDKNERARRFDHAHTQLETLMTVIRRDLGVDALSLDVRSSVKRLESERLEDGGSIRIETRE